MTYLRLFSRLYKQTNALVLMFLITFSSNVATVHTYSSYLAGPNKDETRSQNVTWTVVYSRSVLSSALKSLVKFSTALITT